jgi:hypothetical protein
MARVSGVKLKKRYLSVGQAGKAGACTSTTSLARGKKIIIILKVEDCGAGEGRVSLRILRQRTRPELDAAVDVHY